MATVAGTVSTVAGHATKAPTARGESALRRTLLANALYLVNTAVRSGVTLGMMPLLIAWLGADQYSLWITISTVTLYVCLAEAGLGQAVVNAVGEAYARDNLARVGQVQTTAHALYWMIVVPVGVLSLGALWFLPVDRWLLAEEDLHNGPALIACLRVSIVLSLCRIPMLVFPAMLSGLRMLPQRLTWEIGTGVVAAVGTGTAAWAGMSLLGVTSVTNVLLLAAAVAVYLQSSHGRPWARLGLSHVRAELFRPLATNSAFFFLISGSYLLDRSVLNLLVAKLGTLALVPPMFLLLSVYRVAVWSIINSISRAVQPYVLYWRASGEEPMVGLTLVLSTKLTTLAAAAFVCLATPFAEPAVNFWLGPGSFPGMFTLLMISGSFLIDASFAASANLLVVLNQHRRLALVLGVKSLLVLLLASLLGRVFQSPLEGLAAGVFLATVVGNLAMPALIGSVMRIPGGRYFQHMLIRPAACCILAVVAGWGVSTIYDPAWKTGASLLATATMLAFGWTAVLGHEERSLCLSAPRRLMRGAGRC